MSFKTESGNHYNGCTQIDWMLPFGFVSSVYVCQEQVLQGGSWMKSRGFSARLRDEFSSSDQSRGESYYRNGKVALRKWDSNCLVAKVRGSGHQPYTVEVSFDSSRKKVDSVDCTCPQFEMTDSCKHGWAVLRAIDELIDGQSSDGIQSSNRKSSGKSKGVATATKLKTLCPPAVLEGFKPVLRRSTSKAISIVHKGVVNAANSASLNGLSSAGSQPPATPGPVWQQMLNSIRQEVAVSKSRKVSSGFWESATSAETIYYLLDLSMQETEWPSLKLYLQEETTRNKLKPWYKGGAATESELENSLGDLGVIDARIVDDLLTADSDDDNDDYFQDYRYARKRGYFHYQDRSQFSISDECSPFLLLDLVRTERFFWRVDRTAQPEPVPIKQFVSEPLRPQLALSDAGQNQIRMSLQIPVADQSHPVSNIVWAWESGLFLLPEIIGHVDPLYHPWLLHFMRQGDQCLPADQRDGLLQTLMSTPNLPELVWPDSWGLSRIEGTPQLIFKIKWPDRLPRDLSQLHLVGDARFRYAAQDFRMGENVERKIFDAENSAVISRNRETELEHLNQLTSVEPMTPVGQDSFLISYSSLPEITDQLTESGWLVEAEGKPLTPPGQFSLEVASGLDWFDLTGGATYADQIVPLPVLLQAMRRKENFVRLDNGTHGMLPKEWIDKFGKFLELASVEGDSLRFGKSQALMLDSLLADQEKANRVQLDAGFRKFRKQLQAFDGIKPANEPRTFQGELREYQRDGLGWFGFLQEFGFGGCLADDMGLGKTIQVLALLEQRRSRRLKQGEVRKPSLVVVPRSLIFNWIEEGAKFAPKLQFVDFTGVLRKDREDQLASCDVVLTTYGTLRKDLEKLVAIQFDYVILDEAQAIKNPQTDAAKSCFLLKADHRLSMTGTPIENHFGDLWSQFRFLNPGLLGHSQAFAAFNRTDVAPESLQQLSKAIRPFILRRTKKEVLKELPEKTEQTLVCDMTPMQARQYNELRDHYRKKLDQTVRSLGINRSKIHVLEALLRLRQAACDGRLVNAKQGARGAKIDFLLEQLEEVLGEGHKAIVFSQFTSLLGLLEKDLKQRKIRYEYLDGKTSDRKARVNRFQTDDDCKLFLISLKAGGQGLNLTSADYVYILDPWWNPAAEAQAIDRAHRIGQKKNVFAYRMIAKGTVEEKILELQKTKRELADSIISGNNSLIRTLTADDLQMLLG